MQTIQPEQLQTVIGYQELCSNEAPVTTRATFKLSYLEELIKEIKACPDFKEDDYYNHNVCVIFIREKINKEGIYITGIKDYNGVFSKLAKVSCIDYTQVIPIISGCVSELDQEYQPLNFSYLRNKQGGIPFVKPGGEGSGLIPPPPRGKDDNL
jgi:hypothetical protein